MKLLCKNRYKVWINNNSKLKEIFFMYADDTTIVTSAECLRDSMTFFKTD